jgi:replication factor C subunit 3/5
MNQLWIEQYRPLKFDDIIGQENNIKILSTLIENNSLPHLLLYGKPGTGKTSTIISLVNKLYGDSKTFMLLTLDASDDRGINSVREEIKGFAEKKTLYNKGIKLIILDEADSMTFDAQFALRRIIEKYSNNTRFCLICNYNNKIIPALRVRCLNLKFNSIDKKSMKAKLNIIIKKENIKIKNDSLDIIINYSNGDLRKAINFLQNVSLQNKIITKNICMENIGLPTNLVLNNFFNYLIDIKKDYNYLINFISKNFENKGYSLIYILRELNLFLINNIDKINENNITNYFINLSNLEAFLMKSTFDDIYYNGLVSIFKS